MANLDDQLTGYEEHLRDEGTREDYNREAYGDPCPHCGSLRYGGDCGLCLARDESAALDFEMREAAMKDGGSL